MADSDTLDLVTRLTYEPQYNQPKTVTDALEHTTTYTYDYELPADDPRHGTAGNLVQVTSPAVAHGIPAVNFI